MNRIRLIKLFAFALLIFSLFLGSFTPGLSQEITSDPINRDHLLSTDRNNSLSTLNNKILDNEVIALPPQTSVPTPSIPTSTPLGITPTTETAKSSTTIAPTIVPNPTLPGPTQICQISISTVDAILHPGASNEVKWIVRPGSPDKPFKNSSILRFAISEALSPENPANGVYDKNGHIFTIPISGSEGTVIFLVDKGAKTAEIAAQLIDGDTILCRSERLVLSSIVEVQIVAKDGGRFSDSTGKFFVDLPGNVLPQDAKVSVSIPSNFGFTTLKGNKLPSPPVAGVDIYELLASDSLSGRDIRQLSGDATLSIPVTEELLANYPKGISPAALVVKYYDEYKGVWVTQDTNYDRVTKSLVSKTNHFSLFSTGIDTLDQYKMQPLDAAQTSEFTGSASYSFPIKVPAGPGGVAPSISIDYNSQSVEGLGWGTQGSVLGMGWSLNAGGAVIRTTNLDEHDNADDTFSYSVGGFSSDLIPVSKHKTNNVIDYIDYKSANENFWKIRRYISYVGSSPTTEVNNWVMWDKVGTKYTFNEQAIYYELHFTPPECETCDEGRIYTQRPWGIFLSRIDYPNGAFITFTYQKRADQKYLEGGALMGLFNPYVNLTLIAYAHSNSHPDGYYTVEFAYQNRSDTNASWRTSFTVQNKYEEKYIDEITIKANGNVVRRYDFTYYTDTERPVYPNFKFYPNQNNYDIIGRTLALKSITEKGVGETGTLPPVTFSYGEMTLPSNLKINGLDKMHLTQVDNGQGGKVKFVYEDYDFETTTGSPYQAANPNPVGYWGLKNLSNGTMEFNQGNAYQQAGTIPTRPGSAYFITCNFKSMSSGASFQVVTVNPSDNTKDITSPIYSIPYAPNPQTVTVNAYVYAHPNSPDSSVNLYIRSMGISSFTIDWHQCHWANLVTHYRVVERIVEDSNSSVKYKTTYEYSGASSNDASKYVNTTLYSDSAPQNSQTFINTTFWGHEKVIQRTMSHEPQDPAQTIYGDTVETHYIQNEIQLGAVAVQKIRSEGKYTFKKYEYTYSDLTPTQDIEICAKYDFQVTTCFLDKKIRWSRQIAAESRVYNANEINDASVPALGYPPNNNRFLGTREEYAYDTAYQDGAQYGNQTSTVTRVYNGVNPDNSASWSPYRAERTGYKANVVDGSTNLTGLPAYSSTYQCTGGTCDFQVDDILASSCVIYGNINNLCYINSDGSVTASSPSNARIVATRQLVDFPNSNYDNPLYFDTLNTYTNITGTGINMWLMTEQRAYSDPGTKTSLAATGERLKKWDFNASMGYSTLNWEQNGPDESWRTTYTYSTTPNRNGYDLGLPSSETNVNGKTAYAEYDPFGRIVKLRLPDPNGTTQDAFIVTYTDSSSSSPASIQIQKLFDVNNARKTVYLSYYNGLGQKFVSGQAHVRVFTARNGENLTIAADQQVLNFTRFDALGRVSTTSVPYTIASSNNSYTVPTTVGFSENIYDANSGVLSKTKDPSGRETTYTTSIDIAANGQPSSAAMVTDPSGITQIKYTDAFGHLFKVVQKQGTSTLPEITYAYDEAGHLISITSNGLTTTFTYNLIGQKVSMSDPDMGTWYYGYNTTGDLIWQKDAKGGTTCLFYDTLGRLVGIRDIATGTCPATDPGFDFINPANKDSFAIGYDETGTIPGTITFENTKGRISSKKMPAGTVYYSYDAQGNIKKQVFVMAKELGSYPVDYTYYFDGQPQTVTYPNDSNRRTVTYQRDDAGRNISLQRNGDSDPLIGNNSTAYDERGRMRYLSVGASLFSANDYYAPTSGPTLGERLQASLVKKKGDPVTFFSMTYSSYDLAGNILEVKDLIRNAEQVISYEYDLFNRLTQAQATSNPTTPGYLQEFSYDTSGRLNTRITASGATVYYAYDPAHPHAVTGLSETSGQTNPLYGQYSYDANGNMVSRTEKGITYTQTWTANNLLKKVTWDENGAQPGGVHEITFTYDDAGTRIMRVEKITDVFGEQAEITTIYIGGIYEKQVRSTSTDVTTYLNSWVR